MWTKNDIREHSASRRDIIAAWVTVVIVTTGIFLVSAVIAVVDWLPSNTQPGNIGGRKEKDPWG